MADNPNINVTADTSQATAALNNLASVMGKFSKNMQNTAKSFATVGQKIQDFGDNLYSMGSKITAGISLPIAAVGKKMIEAGASLTAFEATYKQSFKGLTDTATKWSQSFAKSIGSTDTQVRQQILSFNQYAKAMGMTGTEALTFSEKMTTLTDDLGAFYDVDFTEATDRMKSALMGNYEAVDKLGLAFGESTIKAEMAKEGLKGQFADLDSAKKMWVLYNLAVKQSADAQGQAARESNQYQSQIRNIKGQLQELSYKVFTVLLPQIQDFLNRIKDLVSSLQKLSPEQIKFVAKIAELLIIVPFVTMYLGILISSIGRLGKVMSTVVKVIAFFADWEAMALRIMYAWEGLVAFFSGLFSAIGGVIGGALTGIAAAVGLSVGAVIAIIAGIVVVVVLIIMYWDQIKAFTINVWNTITSYLGGAWKSIVDTAKSVWGSITGFFASLWAEIVNIFNTYIAPIGAGIASAFSTIWGVISAFASGFMSVMSAIGSFFAYVWNDLIYPIAVYVGGFFQALGELIAWVFQQVIGNVIDWFANQWSWLYNSVILPIGTTIGNVFTAIGQWFSDMYNSYIAPAIAFLKAAWADVCQAFLAFYQSYIQPVVQAFIAAWDNVKSAFDAVVNFLKAAWQGFVSGLQSIWNAVGVPLINGVKNIMETVRSAWDSTIGRIVSAWNNFIGNLKSAWNSFKSWFKLPHLSISGSWDLTPPDISVPHFNVDWYAKGGIFGSPSVIGVGEGSSSEAVVPLRKDVLSNIGSGIAKYMPDIDKLQQSENSGVVVQVNSLVVREEADVKKIGQELYRLQQRENRSKGRSRL